MNDIVDVVESTVESNSNWGEWLQAPQRWCNREWEHLTFARASLPELGALVVKVGFLLAATPTCYLLGFTGSVLNFCANVFDAEARISAKEITIQAQSIKGEVNLNGRYYSDGKGNIYIHRASSSSKVIQADRSIVEKSFQFNHPIYCS